MVGLSKLDFKTYTNIYGSINNNNSLLGYAKDLLQNLLRIFISIISKRPQYLYLNTAFDIKALIRDCITIIILYIPLKTFQW